MKRALRVSILPVFALVACGGEPKAEPGGASDSTPAPGQAPAPMAKKEWVQVTCAPGQGGNGGKDSLKVDRDTVRLALGDSVAWKTTGNVRSIKIALKAPGAWPFADTIPPSGDSIAVAGDARATGTYSYKIELECKKGNAYVKRVIDPDLIITGTAMAPDAAGPGGPTPAVKQ